MGSPAWTTPFTTTEARIAAPAKIDAGITEWVRERSKIEAETLLQAEGVPATAMNSPSEILASPQYASRNAVTSLPTRRASKRESSGGPSRLSPPRGRTRRRSVAARCGDFEFSRRATCSPYRWPGRCSARSAPR